MASRETENNAYAKFWGNKQRALCYVMVFSGRSISWSLFATEVPLTSLPGLLEVKRSLPLATIFCF